MMLLAAVAPVMVIGCGSSADAASVCSDLKEVSAISGTDSATLKKAANLFAKLADEADDSVRADFSLLSTDETKVLNGRAASVDNGAAEAASKRIGAYEQRVCRSGS
jgi:hypothetical protein